MKSKVKKSRSEAGPRRSAAARAKNPRSSQRSPLSRDRIELAALELIEERGLSVFSQRGLARELGIEAMSLYHWYPSQLDLLNALLDRFLGQLSVPTDGGPAERLTAFALAFRQNALRYPAFVGAFVLLHRWNTETGLALLEALLSVFRDAGLEGERAARRFRAVMNFIMGALLDECMGYARGPGATQPPSDEQVAKRFPLVAAMGPYNKAEHHEANFCFGVQTMLSDLQAPS